MALISDGQWQQIVIEGLGIRSANGPNDNGANYSLNELITNPFLNPIPDDWDARLLATANLIVGYDLDGRVLMIGTKSWGNAPDYPGCFYKSSSDFTQVLLTFDLLQGMSGEQLAHEIVARLPSATVDEKSERSPR